MTNTEYREKLYALAHKSRDRGQSYDSWLEYIDKRYPGASEALGEKAMDAFFYLVWEAEF